MFALIIAAAVAAGLPNYDMHKVCEAAKAATQGDSSVEACLNDEQASKERITKGWGNYTASEKETCVGGSLTELGISYVEIETCFQMEDWKKVPQEVGGTRVPGAHGPQLK
jgi:hypothetical protein